MTAYAANASHKYLLLLTCNPQRYFDPATRGNLQIKVYESRMTITSSIVTGRKAAYDYFLVIVDLQDEFV